jgi:2-oxoglutarate dehydrogenase E2 component (dihydrolipoamide succinyltransferase)
MVEVRIPPLGESVTEGVIVRWLKASGDAVVADEPLLELETDKATMEIPATGAGRLEIVAPEGSTVPVGAVVARIAPDGAAAPAGAPPAAEPLAPAAPAPPAEREARRPSPAPEPATLPPGPAVRKLLAEHDLEPAAIQGTGRAGRVTKGDVLEHLERERAAVPPETEPAAPPPREAPAPPARPATGEDEVERVPMTGLRRRIAERLVEAQRTAAILTTFNEIDCSAVLALRRRYRERFRARHDVDLGLMSLFGRATILALREFPIVNAQLDGGDIVYRRRVHLGIAVATPRGLVVPVVRAADTLGLAELERAIATLAAQAREGRLVPDQLTGGTFTITNGGVFGSLLSTPILNPPQSGILGMHKIEERPVAVDGQVVIRPMMYVALSYDHRLVDGEQAVRFLVRLKELLEDPVRMVLEA